MNFFKRKAIITKARTYDAPTPLKVKTYRTIDAPHGFESPYDRALNISDSSAANLKGDVGSPGVATPNLSTVDDDDVDAFLAGPQPDPADDPVSAIYHIMGRLNCRLDKLESRRNADPAEGNTTEQPADDDAEGGSRLDDGQIAATHSANDPRTGEMASNTSAGLMENPDRNFRAGDAAPRRHPGLAPRRPAELRPLTRAGVKAVNAAANAAAALDQEYARNRRLLASYTK